MPEKTQAIVVRRAGGAEELVWEEVDLAPPARDEVRVVQTAIGLNFIDVYFRSGLYKPPQYPFVPGLEGAGWIDALGAGVKDLALGDWVAYATRPLGAYALERNLPAERIVRLPESVHTDLAAAVIFKGLTAEYLLRRVRRVERGDWVLVHSAAGGVGSLLVQWAKHLGAHVIGTVSSDAKADQARADGAEHVIVTAREDFAARVKELTAGKGCAAVYDAVGRDTFLKSIECTGVRGTLASYGQSSGVIPPFDIALLATNSIFLARPSLFHYAADAGEYQIAAREVFELVRRGVLQCRVGQTYPLRDAARAHRDLEARKTSGSTLLIP